MFIIGNLISLNKVQIDKLTNYYIGVALVALIIFYFGYLFKSYEDKVSFNIYLFFVAVLFLILNITYGTLEMSTQSYVNPPFFILCSLAGIYLNIFVARKITAMNIKTNVLKFIGANTFIIMALHFICFKLVSIMQIEIYKLPLYMLGKFPVIDGSNGWWLLYTIFGVLLPAGLAYSLNNIFSHLPKEILDKYRYILNCLVHLISMKNLFYYF